MTNRILTVWRQARPSLKLHRNLLFFWLLAALPAAASQVTLNVTDFGAKGDAVHFYVNTISNSVMVTTTNLCSSADIGKNIQIFGVGKRTSGSNSYGVVTNGNQDLIATVTNVVNGTNLFLKVHRQDGTTNYPPARTTTAWATLGTDNMLAISNCIAAAAPYTNAIIYIPNGRYLVMPTLGNGGGYALGSIIVTRGGLHFKGESRDQTVLLGRGAWQSYYGVADGSYPFRGFLVQIAAPIANDLPIIFESLTLDGGVQHGYVDAANARGRVNEVDGLGWDEQHGAYLTYDRGNNTGTATLQILTNIAALHWRGEIIKSIDGNVNGRISIRNSVIGDGSATALNVYPAWDIRDNVFSNLFQIAELYQQYYRTTGYFCNNFATNIWGNGFAFNGCVWSAPPFIMQSNTFYFTGPGMNGIQTMPGANIAIIDNQIHCADYMSAICIGAPGAQVINGMYNSNILISGNSIYAPAKLTAVFAFAPDEVNQVEKLTICSNTITAPEQIFYVVRSGGNQHNVRFFDNTINSQLVEWQTGVFGAGKGSLTLVETNNRYTPWPNYIDTLKTNTLSYVKGPKHRMDYVASGNKFILEDGISDQIPQGAVIEIDNRNNRWASLHGGSGGDIVIQSSENPTKPKHILPAGQKMTFHWVNGNWSTNAAPPAPPSNLRFR